MTMIETVKLTRKKRSVHVVKKCGYCNTEFSKPPSLARMIYCCKKCADLAQTTSERKDIPCEACGKIFSAKKDHGAWQRFCCRDCFRASASDLVEKECPTCGNIFKPIRSQHTKNKVSTHCSRECYAESQRTGEQRSCLNCGKVFYTNPSHDNLCCSNKCKNEHFSGSASHLWKGGKFVADLTGHKFVALERPDRVSKYIAEHRMVAIQHIGRLLEQWEKVIHLNSVPDDNRPENLYICGTNSQMRKLFNGTLPWPKKSNLREYK